jgi:uncharacterized protein YbjT (DUF2867 family)
MILVIGARNQVIEVGGPENLSLVEVAGIVQRVTGRAGRATHVPLPLMTVMSDPLRRWEDVVRAQYSRAH